MARSIMLMLALVALAPFASLAATPRPARDCVDPLVVASSANLFPSQFQIIGSSSVAGAQTEVSVAQFFKVAYHSTFKVVTNLLQNETYILTQCGTTAPTAAELELSGDVKFFEIPLSGLSVPDTTVGAFLEALNVLDRVQYATTFSVPACLQSLAETCGLVSNSATSPNITDDESMSATFTTFGSSPNVPKSIAFSAVSDPGPLKRAEWIKFMALFFNKETLANQIFESISENYNTISTAAKAAAAATPKTVAWLTYYPAKLDWGLFDEPSVQFSFPQFKRAFTEDAGATIVDQARLQPFIDSGNLTQPWGSDSAFVLLSDKATFRTLLKDVDVVVDEARYIDDNGVGKANAQIDLNAFLEQYGLDASDVSSLKFLQSGSVLREDGLSNPDSYTEWFGRAIVRPDQTLADLFMALHPSAVPATAGKLTSNLQISQPLFLRSVTAGQQPTVITPSQCVLNGCSLAATPICPYAYINACSGKNEVLYATPQQPCAPTSCPKTQTPGQDSTVGSGAPAGSGSISANPPSAYTKGAPAAARPLLLAVIAAATLVFLVLSASA